ncbi:MAG: 23S rRNA (pseudouridine(1915)-N(3))-methyltransferase RlmH [Verrucomicrobiae bacterium]|nr:23S rRNA (pseudouridine(1915)-N(3))-methyltransferase RlmH [Verrucomicrobiae bacterium]
MIRIVILAVGRMREPWMAEGVAEYLKRLTPMARVEIREAPEEKVPDNPGPAQIRQVLAREAEGLGRMIEERTCRIVLDRGGTPLSSPQFAALIGEVSGQGRSHFTFLIGGSHGLDAGLISSADRSLSFGPMTYPHMLMRVILLEQLYRSFKIIRGEPYHK